MKRAQSSHRTGKRTLEQRLALKFTWLVCGLILISGTIFAASDVLVANYRTTRNLNDQIDLIMTSSRMLDDLAHPEQWLPFTARPFVRVLASDGTVLYKGDLFASTNPRPIDPFGAPRPADESYTIATRTIRVDDRIVGYLQLSGRTLQGIRDVGLKLVEILLITLAMGILTYFLGLAFSRQTLRPVHESQERLEQFTQDASHELRTPLASISSSLDVAMKTGDYEEGILAAKSQVRYASLLIDRLLEVAQLDRAKIDLGPVDLTALVTAVASQHTESCRQHGLALEESIEEGVTVEGDAVLLRQLVNNFVDNAVKFSTTGGTIGVTLTPTELRVSNSVGFIDAGDLPHVFEPFYQSDASHSGQGFGLGLAIVKKIAILHGWHVDVTSSASQGTTFIAGFTAVPLRQNPS